MLASSNIFAVVRSPFADVNVYRIEMYDHTFSMFPMNTTELTTKASTLNNKNVRHI